MPRPNKTKRRGSGLRFFILLCLGSVFACAVAARWAAQSLAPLLERPLESRGSTRIYSAPMKLRPGTAMSLTELESRLQRLGYDTAEEPDAAGKYRAGSDFIDVHLRDFSHPFAKPTPVRVVVGLSGGRVTSVRLATGAPLLEAVVEPELLYEIAGAERIRRERLESSDIPDDIVSALVAVEDRRFWDHRGVDPRAIARALMRNLSAGRFAEGGSTLTQQLARRIYLSPKKTLTRKLREAALAVYLETRFEKREILRLYLENVYFGQNGSTSIVGLPAAARHFFDKASKDLTLPECALLAGLLRSPNRYNPFLNPELAEGRRAVVLAAMRRERLLSEDEEEHAAAAAVSVTRSGHSLPRDADYFLAWLIRRMESRYDDDAVLTRGLIIHTTLDPWLQESAMRAVRKAEHQAALVSLDPRTGAIRALAGGKDFRTAPYDRAALARRQPGSAFKPFVYGAALAPRAASASAWTPASLLPDTTRAYRVEGGSWTPHNYDGHYRGTVVLREAFSHSINAAAVALAADVGIDAVIDYAVSLGIRSPLRRELGLALGSSEVTLLELVAAYCVFANGGYRVEPHGVDAVVDEDGVLVEYHEPLPLPVLSAPEAYLMTDLLRETVRTGTAQSLKAFGLEKVSAGKTGTTDKGTDAWFVGYTPRLAAGVWTGSDLPRPLGLSGAGAALPIWADFMRGPSSGLQGTEEALWPQPDGVHLARIDPATGLLARAGCPQKRSELFLAGTVPTRECALHATGIGGWLKRWFED